MVSGPTSDIFLEYQANDGKTLGIKRFVKDGVKMVTVNDIELTLDSLISMIVDVDVVERPRLGDMSEDSAESAEGSEESVEESESDSSFAEPDPDTDSDYEENDTHALKDVSTQSQEDFKNLLSFIISIYVVIVSIIAGLIFTNIIR